MLDFINTWLGTPLGYALHIFYSLTGSFPAAVLLFALAMRLLLLWPGYASHMNAIKHMKMQPALRRLERAHAADRESFYAARVELFRHNRYSPALGLAPLLVQLAVLMGVLQVMYHPLQHVLRMHAREIERLVQGIGGAAAQLAAADGLIDMGFFGINLARAPGFSAPLSMLVPALSGLTSALSSACMNRLSPGALTQSERTNLGFGAFTAAFSVYFALVTPAAVGVYWIAGNLLAVFSTLAFERLFSPRRLAPEAYARIKAGAKTKQQRRAESEKKKELARRSRAGARAFALADKELVFYALSGGQYKFYRSTIEYVLQNSGAVVHYLTNDPDDRVLGMESERLRPYFATEAKTVSLLLRLDCKLLVTTVQDFHTYHLKRTVARPDTEYVHIPHGPGSLHLTARAAAYDHFDTFFCAGPHQAAELRRREEMKKIRKKTLVKVGYGLLDDLAESFAGAAAQSQREGERPSVLVAPSWQQGNLLDLCIGPLLDGLFGRGWTVVLRPHPQFLRVCPEEFAEIAEKYESRVRQGELVLDTDFLDSGNIFRADALVTDWSGIAFEFSFTTLRPSVFVDTPMKVMNPDWEKYGLEPTDISWRRLLGVRVDAADAGKAGDAVAGLLADRESHAAQIKRVADEQIYHRGRSGEAGGRYLLGRLA